MKLPTETLVKNSQIA